jgi:ribosomal protein L37AE/L43A
MTTVLEIMQAQIAASKCSLCGVPIGERRAHPDALFSFLGGTYHHADGCCRHEGPLCRAIAELDKRRAAVAAWGCPTCGAAAGAGCTESGLPTNTHSARIVDVVIKEPKP